MPDDAAPRIPRARPVADLPLERLEAQAEQLARHWAAELAISRPLATLGAVSLETLAREGPEVCRQLLRALSSDAELERLLAAERNEQGAPYPQRAAALAGSSDAGSVIDTLESLRGVLWEAILRELAGGFAGGARERQLADASDRLAHVCAAMAASAAMATPPARPSSETRASRFPERPPAGSRRTPESRIAIVDERGLVTAGAGSSRERRAEGAPASATRGEPPRATPTRSAPARAEIAIRDARAEQGPAAWIHTIGRQLERFASDGMPFAVVLLEAAIVGGDGAAAEAEIDAALTVDLRDSGGGTSTRERAGRYWLLVPRADRIGAHALAGRLERTVRAAAARSGASVTVATGTAVCPEDGSQAAALAAHADIGLYAARWESRSGFAREAAVEEGL